jgi:hypothetical protein
MADEPTMLIDTNWSIKQGEHDCSKYGKNCPASIRSFSLTKYYDKGNQNKFIG